MFIRAYLRASTKEQNAERHVNHSFSLLLSMVSESLPFISRMFLVQRCTDLS